MADITPPEGQQNNGLAGAVRHVAGFTIFASLADFSQAVAKVTGQDLDTEAIVNLDTDFVQSSERYLLLNIKEYGSARPDNLLFLNENYAYALSDISPAQLEVYKDFEDILTKPYGKTTVLCLLVIDKVEDNHKMRLDSFIRRAKQIEGNFDHVQYRDLSLEYERLGDRLEELHDLLLRLQERYYKQVETQLISFDYRVLLAESASLQSRCRRRTGSLRELRQEHEMQATEELNQRIVRLNDVVKKLTAITVILMIPTLIASHFGMNFAFMPELKVWWVYPAVVIFQFVFMGIGFWLFRRIGWL
jgi:hypothetical protein